MSDKDKAALLAGEPVLGNFNVAGARELVPAMLRWTAESGARLDLIDQPGEFPRTFDGPRFAVHGETRDGGRISLHDCLLRQLTSFDNLPTRVSAATLAWGAHVMPRDRWPRAIYQTACLSAWRNDTGIHHPRVRGKPHVRRTEWRPPARDVVKVAGASLTFAGTLESEVRRGSEHSMRAHAVMVVDGSKPLTIERYRNDHALPLLTLMALAADRPDDLTREVYLDPEARDRRIEVWRMGRTIENGEWHRRFLFEADELVDYSKAIHKWWVLHHKVWPALLLYGDHVQEGNSFSPGRFLTAYSGVEVYGEARLKDTTLKRIRDFADVDSKLIGCTNEWLKLIKISRGYFAHFNNAPTKRERQRVQEGVFDCTRRLNALMQACLLRELGFDREQRESMLRAHYANWPLA